MLWRDFAEVWRCHGGAFLKKELPGVRGSDKLCPVMMTRPFRFFIAVLVLVNASGTLQAAEVENEGTWQRKLQRGFLNVALSPLEISNELDKEKKNDTLPPSWIAGAGRGAAFMVGRALVGVYEMVTFPLAYPNCYKPVLQPEFAWQHLPSDKK